MGSQKEHDRRQTIRDRNLRPARQPPRHGHQVGSAEFSEGGEVQESHPDRVLDRGQHGEIPHSENLRWKRGERAKRAEIYCRVKKGDIAPYSLLFIGTG